MEFLKNLSTQIIRKQCRLFWQFWQGDREGLTLCTNSKKIYISKNTNCIFYSLKFLLGNAIPYRTFLCIGPTPTQLSSGNCLQLLSFPANFWFSFLNCTEHSGPFILYSPTVLQNHPSIQLQPAIPRINSTSSESNKSIQRWNIVLLLELVSISYIVFVIIILMAH